MKPLAFDYDPAYVPSTLVIELVVTRNITEAIGIMHWPFAARLCDMMVDGIDVCAFSTPVAVAHLQKDRCREIPHAPGVYLVLRALPTPPAFVASSPAGWFKRKDPSVPVAVLEANWVKDARILYIGKAGGKKGLYQRLKQYMDHGRGKPVGHRGGRYIWQLADSQDLLVCWQTVLGREPRTVEKTLLAEFNDVHDCHPFANLAG